MRRWRVRLTLPLAPEVPLQLQAGKPFDVAGQILVGQDAAPLVPGGKICPILNQPGTRLSRVTHADIEIIGLVGKGHVHRNSASFLDIDIRQGACRNRRYAAEPDRSRKAILVLLIIVMFHAVAWSNLSCVRRIEKADALFRATARFALRLKVWE